MHVAPLVVFFIEVASGVICCFLARRGNRRLWLAFTIGFFLNFIGILIYITLHSFDSLPKYKTCECGEIYRVNKDCCPSCKSVKGSLFKKEDLK